MSFKISRFNEIFQEAIKNYHIKNSVEQEMLIPYSEEDNYFEFLLFKKCWIDSLQWHCEDIIRDIYLDSLEVVKLKRKIDYLNQQRTNLVELTDDYLFDKFKSIPQARKTRINTETPGWALDRLSILNLKIYHWQEETLRIDVTQEHIKKAKDKLDILENQMVFLTNAIYILLDDMSEGKIIVHTYKQMKMYNDPETNPYLRKKDK